ncbi:MAG: hypothetical protein ACREA2_03375, partial [Blastocatellia bacterium]
LATARGTDSFFRERGGRSEMAAFKRSISALNFAFPESIVTFIGFDNIAPLNNYKSADRAGLDLSRQPP